MARWRMGDLSGAGTVPWLAAGDLGASAGRAGVLDAAAAFVLAGDAGGFLPCRRQQEAREASGAAR